MRLLMIDNGVKHRIQEAIDYAEAHPITAVDILIMKAGAHVKKVKAASRFIHIPIGYSVFYSIEHHQAGKYRHLCVAIDTPKRVAHPMAVGEILKEYGFDMEGVLHTWLEEEHSAVNVLQKLPK